ncbi:hypothetical protein HYT53_03705 [Candidatus Woesearchaeota archaeon]|nr:hypothetical protein [Candidatus Woesearchaeota archaeon]
MNSKAKLKITELMTVLMIQLVLTLPFYTANVYGLTISNARATKVTSNSATIEWTTDEMADGKVHYGKTSALGFKQVHDNFVNNHTVTVISGIESDTTYFFAVESMNLAGSSATDNNSNSFYTFRTADITPPPQVTGLSALSSTQDSISISWNSMNIPDLSHYLIYRNFAVVGNSTANTFNDTGLQAKSSFSYRVSAVDASGNEGAQSNTLAASTGAVDSSAPAITSVDILPVADTTARATWLTDENATTIVLYGTNRTDKIKSSTQLVTNHSIVIDGLVKNTRYIFIVKSCDASGNCANSSGRNFTAGRDITPPFINASIPRFVNRRVIDIVGSTEPFSSVSLFVNDMGIPKRSLSGNEVGSSGRFVFSQIQLNNDNIVKITVADKSGNRNQKIFEVSVDTEKPVVQLDDIPSLTSKQNLTISGFVNEQALIKVFVDAKANDTAVPSRIAGLNATRIGQNFVELHWDESKDKDFSHYVVYREDSSPIALTKPANFNLFIDALVDSGKTYTYEVSAVNNFANEGPKSGPVAATTLKGGAILNLKYPEVDILEDFRKPVLVLNGSGVFNFGIRLNKGDGNYFIKLVFEDRAENSVVFERNVVLDTKKPDVKITSPPSGALLFENAANEVNVIGTTKPNARVHLFVDRTPFSSFNATFELSGLANEVQNIAEPQLDAKCRFNVASKSLCSTGADFSTTSDSSGNFKFENVDLTAIFGGAARLREVPVSDFRDTSLEEAKDSKTTTLVVIATDATGQRGFATRSVRIGTCWSGNQSWDVIPLANYQSPPFLSTERMAEGTETIYFIFNYSYIGRGINPKIKGVLLSKACSTRELLDPRFNISCQIMPSSNSPKLLNPPDNTVSYSAMTLSRFPGMDSFLEKDWKSFLKAINKELTFPVKVKITYQHDMDNDGVLETETQTTCEQVSYVVDSTIIDPRKFLPDWLLFDFVNFLQSSIKTLTSVQEQIDKLLDFAAVGCIASFGLNLVLGIYRRWIAFWEEKPFLILKRGLGASEIFELFEKKPLKPANKGDKDDCQRMMEDIAEKKGSFQMKYVTDADLRKCFPASAGAWESEASAYNWFRWSCDRVFGHAAPAKWTEKKDDTDLYNKVTSIEGCGVDQSVRGLPLNPEKCRDVAASFQLNKEIYNIDDKCFKVEKGGKKALFRLGKQSTGNLYELERLTGPSEITISYAVKKDEFHYITAQQKSCAEICGVKPQDQQKKNKVNLGGTPIQIEPDPKSKSSNKIGYACTKVDTCRSFNQNKQISAINGSIYSIQSALTAGYTNDCFYTGNNAEAVSDLTATREECCCINAKETKLTTNYYSPDDKAVYETQSPVHEPKKASASAETQGLGSTDFEQMKWSYRYFKEKFEARDVDDTSVVHNEYNPKRYIEGRDLPACFGQNHWIYEPFKPETVMAVDPFKDHWAAVQCVHLAGISNRIQFIKNLMTSMSTCLIQVRTTGRGDSGACKELFTQYLCSAIWQVIRWFVDGCTPQESGTDVNAQSDSIIEYVKSGFKGIHEGITDLQQQLRNEYGNAKLNEILGTGEESVARKICLGAFGYDWEINVKNIVDAAYATPFATLVQPITRSREFLTVDPVRFTPKYEYRASWIINPGCDFERYDVQLACVGRKQLDLYPNQINCGALGAPSIAYTGALGTSAAYSQCDCINLADERKGPLVFNGRLKQNVLEEKAIPSGRRVIDDNVRYDHLKFTLRTDRKIQANIKPNCYPQGYDDGVFYFPLIDRTARDILDCRLDELSGSFICGDGATFANRKGIAYFTDVRIDGVDINKREELVFSVGSAIGIDATVNKIGQDKCLRATLDGVEKDIVPIVSNGTHQYRVTISLPSDLQVEQIVGDKRGLDIEPVELSNEQIVRVFVKFYDMNNDGAINFFGDEDSVSVLDPSAIKKISESEYLNRDEGAFIIQKEGVKLKIKSANLQLAADGRTALRKEKPQGADKPVGVVGGTLEVRPVRQTTAATPQSTPRNLVLALYHLKQNVDSFSNPEECSFNDPVLYPDKPQQKIIPIRIETKRPQGVGLQGALIKDAKVEPSQVSKDQIEAVKISTTMKNPSDVKDIIFYYTSPDSIEKTATFNPTTVQNVFEGTIQTSEFSIAGEYQGKVTATSKSRAGQDTFNTKFEVLCGDKDNGYGSCKDITSCTSKQFVTAGFPCLGAIEEQATSSVVCCKT